jgi:hypothetical protein
MKVIYEKTMLEQIQVAAMEAERTGRSIDRVELDSAEWRRLGLELYPQITSLRGPFFEGFAPARRSAIVCGVKVVRVE